MRIRAGLAVNHRVGVPRYLIEKLPGVLSRTGLYQCPESYAALTIDLAASLAHVWHRRLPWKARREMQLITEDICSDSDSISVFYMQVSLVCSVVVMVAAVVRV